MRSWKPIALGVTLALSSQFSWAAVIETTRLVGFGEAKYPENFTHFDYVNPQAPKYGKVTFGELAHTTTSTVLLHVAWRRPIPQSCMILSCFLLRMKLTLTIP